MNVLISSTTFIPSVILCGHSQLDHLQKQGKVNYKFVISHFTDKKNIEWADIIVFLRSDSEIDKMTRPPTGLRTSGRWRIELTKSVVPFSIRACNCDGESIQSLRPTNHIVFRGNSDVRIKA